MINIKLLYNVNQATEQDAWDRDFHCQVQFTLEVKVYKVDLEMQTCRITLALAYILYHLSAAWLQLQIEGRSLRGK